MNKINSKYFLLISLMFLVLLSSCRGSTPPPVPDGATEAIKKRMESVDYVTNFTITDGVKGDAGDYDELWCVRATGVYLLETQFGGDGVPVTTTSYWVVIRTNELWEINGIPYADSEKVTGFAVGATKQDIENLLKRLNCKFP